MQQITSKIEDLESRSKELYELLFLEKFTVKKVIATSHPTSFITSEVIGVRLPTYEGGFISKLILEVTPENYNIPIRILNFNGYSIVKRDDYI